MRMVDIISKKRYGGQLSREEIDFFIRGYTMGTIPDYQASALAMATLCFWPPDNSLSVSRVWTTGRWRI